MAKQATAKSIKENAAVVEQSIMSMVANSRDRGEAGADCFPITKTERKKLDGFINRGETELPVKVDGQWLDLDNDIEPAGGLIVVAAPGGSKAKAAPKAKSEAKGEPKAKAERKPRAPRDPNAPRKSYYKPSGDALLTWVPGSIEEAKAAIKSGEFVRPVPKAPQLGDGTKLFFASDEGFIGDAVIFGHADITGVETVDGKMQLTLANPTFYKDAKDYNALVADPAVRFRGIKRVDSTAILAKGAATKEIPSVSHAGEVPEGAAASGQDWTEDETKEMVKVVKEAANKNQGFKAFAAQSNRTVLSVSYKYYGLAKKGRIDDKGNLKKAEAAS